MAVAVAVDVVVAAAAVHLGDTCNQGDDGRNAPIAGGVVAALEGASSALLAAAERFDRIDIAGEV